MIRKVCLIVMIGLMALACEAADENNGISSSCRNTEDCDTVKEHDTSASTENDTSAVTENDTEAAAPIALRIENRRSETVYIAGRWGCRDREMIALRDTEDTIIVTARSCDQPGAANSCEPAVAYKLLPGATQVIEIEAASYGEPNCQLEELADDICCTSRNVLPPGSYSFQVSWYQAMYNNDDCIPETEGAGCSLLGSAGAGDRIIAAVDWEFPTNDPVVLTIE